jgi:hypothetical protein
LISPDVFEIEVAHAQTRVERQGKIAVGSRQYGLGKLTQQNNSSGGITGGGGRNES